MRNTSIIIIIISINIILVVFVYAYPAYRPNLGRKHVGIYIERGCNGRMPFNCYSL